MKKWSVVLLTIAATGSAFAMSRVNESERPCCSQAGCAETAKEACCSAEEKGCAKKDACGSKTAGCGSVRTGCAEEKQAGCE